MNGSMIYSISFYSYYRIKYYNSIEFLEFLHSIVYSIEFYHSSIGWMEVFYSIERGYIQLNSIHSIEFYTFIKIIWNNEWSSS